MADREFPYTVSYGLSRVFRVRHVGVGTYYVEQRVARSTKTEPPKWQCIAISQHFDPSEALEVMHEAQKVYAIEVHAKRDMMKRMA